MLTLRQGLRMFTSSSVARMQGSPGYVNCVTLVGNIGPMQKGGKEGDNADKEGAKSYLRFSLAVDKPLSKAARESQTENDSSRTQWFSVVVFNPSLIKYAEKFDKGTKVFVQGSIQLSKYMSNNTEKLSVSIFADNIVPLSKKKQQAESEEAEDEAENNSKENQSKQKKTIKDI